jgi:hypothetical protein
MAMRKYIVLLVALAGFFRTGAAAADTETIWQPRVSATGGYDDNVQINGSGGDGFGQISPGVKVNVYGEHRLRVGFDCEVGLARLARPDEFGFSSSSIFADEYCSLDTSVNLSARDKFKIRLSATYAQDPFALANLGLLLRAGQTNIFVGRLSVEDTHALSGHTGINYGLEGAVLTFGAGDAGNNYVLAPRVRYEWKTSQRSKWDVGVREQLFFGIGAAANPGGKTAGLLGEGHSLLLGYTYDLTDWADVTVRGGPAVVTADTGIARNSGNAIMPDRLHQRFRGAADLRARSGDWTERRRSARGRHRRGRRLPPLGAPRGPRADGRLPQCERLRSVAAGIERLRRRGRDRLGVHPRAEDRRLGRARRAALRQQRPAGFSGQGCGAGASDLREGAI